MSDSLLISVKAGRMSAQHYKLNIVWTLFVDCPVLNIASFGECIFIFFNFAFCKIIETIFMWQLSERTIGQWLEYWAEKTPEKEYIVYSDRNLRWTFRYFNQRVDELAKGLMTIGVKKGTHVGIWASNIPDWTTMLMACSKIGAVTITVNTNFKIYEAEDLIRRSDMEVLCIVDHEKGNSFIDMTYEILPDLKIAERGKLADRRFPHMKAVIYMGTESHRGMYTVNELMMLGLTVSDADYQAAKDAVNCYEVINIQYTSGTTGFPKGAMLSHYGICNNGYLTGEHLGFDQETKLCICVPLFHCFGLVLGVLNCLVHGCTMVVVKRFDPLLVLASIHKERCTSLYGVPTMYLGILNHPMFNMFDLTSLKAGIMAGALCPVDLVRDVEAKMHMIVTSEYGLTEASPGMTQTRWTDPLEVRCHTVGREFEYSEVKVLDPDGNECPVGVEGEMCNRGYNNMIGYYNDPEGTAEMIDKNNFLHSGDLGYKDADGNFHITGRIKEMIIRGGENIYPSEIETFLQQIGEINIVQVVGVPSPKYGESVGAFIQLKKGAKLEESDIKDFCKDRIARYKVPKYIFFVDEFPLTGSGKIQKFKLKEMSVELCKQRGITII